MTLSPATARRFLLLPVEPCSRRTAAPALPTRACPVSAGEGGKQAQSHGRTYLKLSHSTGPPAGREGSRRESGASRGSSPYRAPGPARASLRDPPRSQQPPPAPQSPPPPPPGAQGGRAASLPRPFVCRGGGGGGGCAV